MVKGQDYEVVFNENYTRFEVIIYNPGDFAYSINYSTTGTLDGNIVGNKVKVFGDNGIAIADKVDSTKTEIVQYRASKVSDGGMIEIDASYRINIYKADVDSGKKNQGVIFEIEKPDGTVVELDPTDENGLTQSPQFTSSEIMQGEFLLREKQAAPGYVKSNIQEQINISADGITKTFYNERIKMDIPVTVEWVGNRLSEVELKLFDENHMNRAVKTLLVSETDNWQSQFNRVPKYDELGNEIIYKLVQTPIENYSTEMSGSHMTGFKIKNTNTEKVNIGIEKQWIGKELDKVEAQLYQNGILFQTFAIKKENGYKVHIDGLPKYDVQGNLYHYEVKEILVDGYESKILREDNLFMIQNTKIVTQKGETQSLPEKPEGKIEKISTTGKSVSTNTKSPVDTSDYFGLYVLLGLISVVGLSIIRISNKKA